VVYTYPSKKALASIIGRVRALTTRSSHPALAVLLRQLNPVLQGWCTYFRYGVSKATFGYLDQYAWHRVVRWLRKRHPTRRWRSSNAAIYPGGDRPRTGDLVPAAAGDGQPLPLPGEQHPNTLGKRATPGSAE
jgi:hypothetical protein